MMDAVPMFQDTDGFRPGEKIQWCKKPESNRILSPCFDNMHDKDAVTPYKGENNVTVKQG